MDTSVEKIYLYPFVEQMFFRYPAPITQSEKKVLKALKKLVERLYEVSKDMENNKEGFLKLWKENWVIFCSNKYRTKIHNAAALIYEENVLRPFGRYHGHLK